MTPRNTKHGATAKAKRSASKPRAVASSRTKSRANPRTKNASSSRTPSRARGPKRAPRPWWTVPAVSLAVVAFFVWTFYPVAAVQYREMREARRLSAELTALRERNDRLRTQVDRLKTPAGVEDYARSQLGLVKNGESVAVVVDGDEAQESSAKAQAPEIDSDEAVQSPVGPWTAFLDLVFGVNR